MADNPDEIFGGYSADPDLKFVRTPRQGLSSLGDNVTYAAGCNDAKCLRYDPEAIKTAVQGASFVFVCLGTGECNISVYDYLRDLVQQNSYGYIVSC